MCPAENQLAKFLKSWLGDSRRQLVWIKIFGWDGRHRGEPGAVVPFFRRCTSIWRKKDRSFVSVHCQEMFGPGKLKIPYVKKHRKTGNNVYMNRLRGSSINYVSFESRIEMSCH